MAAPRLATVEHLYHNAHWQGPTLPFKGRARVGMGWRYLPLDPPPSSTARPGAVGEHCLSAQRELRSRPAWRAAQGTPEGGCGWGSPSLGYLSWRSKKGNQPPGCPRQANTRKAHETILHNATNLDLTLTPLLLVHLQGWILGLWLTVTKAGFSPARLCDIAKPQPRLDPAQFLEDVYLKGYATLPELLLGLTEYFVFYNTERTHQSLDYSTPDEVYRTASGGGATIVDKFTERKENHQETESEAKPGQRRAAACERLPS